MWEKIGEWKFDRSGPFYVAVNGDDCFFVTDTGRVFFAPRNARPMTPLKEIWKGPPVDALIHDSDAKKFYGFTKNHFFEIADPIKPIPHAIRIKRSWTANAAIETAAECGQAIRTRLAPAM